ncbi:peptidase C39 family protein, partial [Streptomyces fimicarius]
MTSPTSRRTVLTAALAAAAGAGTVASATPATAAASSSTAPSSPAGSAAAPKALVDNRFWHTYTDWRCGTGDGTRVLPGARPGLVIATPAGRADHTDPHTGTTAAWDYATWTSAVHRSAVPATEVIASWNARTPAGTWIQVELSGAYADGTATPWFVMGRWAAGDGDIRRTSVD